MRKFSYAVVVVTLVLAGCTPPGAPTVSAPKLDPVVGTWGVETADMDPSVRPGDDFYDYVVGSWLDSVELADSETCLGAITDVNTQVNDDVADIVATAKGEHAAAGEPAQQISDLYASYTDTATLDDRGLQPVQPYLAAIDGVSDRPALDRMLTGFARGRRW